MEAETKKPTLSAPQIIQIAAVSETDPRTVKRFLAEKYVRPLSKKRILRALEAVLPELSDGE